MPATRSLRYSPGWCNPCAALWYCMWGQGPRGNNAACLALGWLSVTSPATHMQIGPFWCWFPGGWVCAHSRTLGVSPVNSPVRLGVSPAASTPTGVFSQRFWGFISPCWNPGLCGLSHSPFVPPGLSTHKCGAAHSPSQHLFWSSSCLSQVLTTLAVCLSLLLIVVWMNISSFKSLVVRLPYSSIFWQFWLFFAFKLVSFFWLCKEEKRIYLCLHLGWKSETPVQW